MWDWWIDDILFGFQALSFKDFPGGASGEESTGEAGDSGLIPGDLRIRLFLAMSFR